MAQHSDDFYARIEGICSTCDEPVDGAGNHMLTEHKLCSPGCRPDHHEPDCAWYTKHFVREVPVTL